MHDRCACGVIDIWKSRKRPTPPLKYALAVALACPGRRAQLPAHTVRVRSVALLLAISRRVVSDQVCVSVTVFASIAKGGGCCTPERKPLASLSAPYSDIPSSSRGAPRNLISEPRLSIAMCSCVPNTSSCIVYRIVLEA